MVHPTIASPLPCPTRTHTRRRAPCLCPCPHHPELATASPTFASPPKTLAARSGRYRTAQPANGVLPLSLACSPLPVHREPASGYKKPPRALEATRTTPSTLPHSLLLSAPPGGRKHHCRRLWPWSSSSSTLGSSRGRRRPRGRAALFSSPHPSVSFPSRPGTHPHAFIVLRSTPGARR